MYVCSGVGVEWSEAAGVESEEKERGTEEGEERTYIYLYIYKGNIWRDL